MQDFENNTLDFDISDIHVENPLNLNNGTRLFQKKKTFFLERPMSELDFCLKRFCYTSLQGSNFL